MFKSLSILLLFWVASTPAAINKLSFYKAFESEAVSIINKELVTLKKTPNSVHKDAFVGALIMKKSQFEKTPKEKISVFKEGKTLLESAISKQPKNGEFRFLRLAIQENSPKILKYNTHIESDISIIIQSYKSLDSTVKKVIKEYAKQSEKLSSEKLK